MIEVKIRPGEIQITGHSGYAAEGKDIVCAGVSALFQTMIKSIGNLAGEMIEYDLRPGKSYMRYRNPSDISKVLVDSFIIGVALIANEYPDNVKTV